MNLYFLFYFILPSCIAGDDKNGGVICAACGVVGAWVEEDGFTRKNQFKKRPVYKTMHKQYASSKEKSAHDAIADMCRFFPTDLEKICNLAINELS